MPICLACGNTSLIPNLYLEKFSALGKNLTAVSVSLTCADPNCAHIEYRVAPTLANREAALTVAYSNALNLYRAKIEIWAEHQRQTGQCQ